MQKLKWDFSDPAVRLVYADWLEEQGKLSQATSIRMMEENKVVFPPPLTPHIFPILELTPRQTIRLGTDMVEEFLYLLTAHNRKSFKNALKLLRRSNHSPSLTSEHNFLYASIYDGQYPELVDDSIQFMTHAVCRLLDAKGYLVEGTLDFGPADYSDALGSVYVCLADCIFSEYDCWQESQRLLTGRFHIPPHASLEIREALSILERHWEWIKYRSYEIRVLNGKKIWSQGHALAKIMKGTE